MYDPKVLKLGIENDIWISHKWYGFGVERLNVRPLGVRLALRMT